MLFCLALHTETSRCFQYLKSWNKDFLSNVSIDNYYRLILYIYKSNSRLNYVIRSYTQEKFDIIIKFKNNIVLFF